LTVSDVEAAHRLQPCVHERRPCQVRARLWILPREPVELEHLDQAVSRRARDAELAACVGYPYPLVISEHDQQPQRTVD